MVANARPSNDLERIQQDYFREDLDPLDHDNWQPLPERLEEKKAMYEQVYNWLLQYSHNKTEKRIVKIYNVGQRQAKNILVQTLTIFGQYVGQNKGALRSMQIQRREREIDLIRKEKKISAEAKSALISKHYENIEKMGGLHEQDGLSLEDVKELLTIPQAVRTTNPEALKNIEEAEIVEE